MKIREIILDFTSLLDVIMIILFFFILFSTLEVESVSQSAEEARVSYETMMEEHALEQEEFRAMADAEWDRILHIDENAAGNQQALTAFDRGAVIALNLQDVQKSTVWTLRILSGDTILGTLDAAECDELPAKLAQLLEQEGFQPEDVLISTLTYDGNAPGTAGAVPKVEDAVRELQESYQNLYFTTINVSK